MLRDLAFAARTLRKNAAFSLTAIVTLALGIGATTAIFSVVNAVLLRPLPYDHPERLTIIWGELRQRQVYDWLFAPGDLKDLMDQATLFDGIAGFARIREGRLQRHAILRKGETGNGRKKQIWRIAPRGGELHPQRAVMPFPFPSSFGS